MVSPELYICEDNIYQCRSKDSLLSYSSSSSCMNVNMASKQQSVALGCKSELKIQEDYLNHERIHQFDLLLNQ